MRPSFLLVFGALLSFDANVAAAVAGISAVMPLLTTRRPKAAAQAFMDAVVVVIATLAAGATQDLFASFAGPLNWPWRAVPLATSVVVYVALAGALTELAIPLIRRQRVDPSWPNVVLRGCPLYLVGASLAATLVVLVQQQMWSVLPVAAVSTLLAGRVYADYVDRLAEAHRRREVLDFLEQGMTVVDANGCVTLWNDAVERLLGCSRNDALGRRLEQVVPALSRTELPQAIKDTLSDGASRTTPQLRLSAGQRTRILQVKVVPVADGLALLWHDITERTQAEHELKQTGERLALAAEGANDGLWQWNLQTQEFYVSGRWRAMLGLSGESETARPDEWLNRVHPDDAAGLKQALDAHLAGHSTVFRHEHRLRHADGSYRRFLCRGVAVTGRARRPIRIAGSLTDTTEQALAQERLRSVGVLDPLTGLLNRAIFVEGLGRRLDDFKNGRVRGWFAVLYLDLDRFKIVNDSLGHLVGDELLIGVSRRLESCIRP